LTKIGKIYLPGLLPNRLADLVETGRFSSDVVPANRDMFQNIFLAHEVWATKSLMLTTVSGSGYTEAIPF
jgi:hypothetical protein